MADLAASIERTGKPRQDRAGSTISRIPRDTPPRASFEQERLWFLNKCEPDSAFYNVPFMLRLTGVLDAKAMGRSLEEIVRRHETLRTTFDFRDAQIVQMIAPAMPLALPVEDLSRLPETERDDRLGALAGVETRRPFDLRQGPQIRCKLFRLQAEEYVLLPVSYTHLTLPTKRIV